MTSKRCKIHYRRLRRDTNQFPSMSLAEALSAALNTKTVDGTLIKSKAAHRLTEVPAQPQYRRLLNNFYEEPNLAFGNTCLFSPGQMQALLEMKASEGEHISLAEVLEALAIAEQQAPEGKEYLHGITYWTVIGDHVYQVQHLALQSRSLEEYFTWLLRKAGVIRSQQHVELQAEFDRAQIGDDLGDVRAIEVGGILPEPMVDAIADTKLVESESREAVGERLVKTFQKARQILVDLLGDVEAEKIIDSIPPEASLEVNVSIGYRAIKRKFQKEFMRNLATGLRNIPDGEIRVRGKDGEIKGDDARLSADMSIKRLSENSSLLDLADTLRQMKEVHRRFLHDGRIKA